MSMESTPDFGDDRPSEAPKDEDAEIAAGIKIINHGGFSYTVVPMQYPKVHVQRDDSPQTTSWTWPVQNLVKFASARDTDGRLAFTLPDGAPLSLEMFFSPEDIARANAATNDDVASHEDTATADKTALLEDSAADSDDADPPETVNTDSEDDPEAASAAAVVQHPHHPAPHKSPSMGPGFAEWLNMDSPMDPQRKRATHLSAGINALSYQLLPSLRKSLPARMNTLLCRSLPVLRKRRTDG
jgi:hypothetical protein